MRLRKLNVTATLFALASPLVVSRALAAVPDTVNLQGVLRDRTTGTVVNGPRNLHVELVEGGSAFCPQDFPATSVQGGVFSVDYTGAGCGLTNQLRNRTGVTFRVTVDTDTLSAELLKSVPYALIAGQAADAQTLGGISASQFVKGSDFQPDTVTCPAGGYRINLSGGPEFVCNGQPGASGSQGPAGATPVGASEAPNAGTCPYGGSRFDTQGQAPVFACNGAPGAQGLQGSPGLSVAMASYSGAPCANGGVELTVGTNTQVICHGQAGAAGAAGTSVTSSAEPPGGNCQYGGVRFISASGTNYACNGAPGGGGGASVVAHGVATHASSTPGAQAIPHGLGRIPKRVRLEAVCAAGGGQETRTNTSIATYIPATSTLAAIHANAVNNAGFTTAITQSTIAIRAVEADNISRYTEATITSVDATNINLNWVNTGSPTQTVAIHFWVEDDGGAAAPPPQLFPSVLPLLEPGGGQWNDFAINADFSRVVMSLGGVCFSVFRMYGGRDSGGLVSVGQPCFATTLNFVPAVAIHQSHYYFQDATTKVIYQVDDTDDLANLTPVAVSGRTLGAVRALASNGTQLLVIDDTSSSSILRFSAGAATWSYLGSLNVAPAFAVTSYLAMAAIGSNAFVIDGPTGSPFLGTLRKFDLSTGATVRSTSIRMYQDQATVRGMDGDPDGALRLLMVRGSSLAPGAVGELVRFPF